MSNDEFVLINVLKEIYDIKEEIKNSNKKEKFRLYIKQCYLIVRRVEQICKDVQNKYIYPEFIKTKHGRIMILPKCSVF